MEQTFLVAGIDYPNTYSGFVEMFSDNVACAGCAKTFGYSSFKATSNIIRGYPIRSSCYNIWC